MPEFKIYQASLTQQQFYFLHRMNIEGQPLNTGMTIRIKGSLDTIKLINCLKNLTNLHEQLRTTFHEYLSSIECHSYQNYEQ